MKKIFIILSILLGIIVIFSFLPRYIYNNLSIENKFIIKEKITFYYENKIDDKYKIIFRSLNIDPFFKTNLRYRRLNPKIENLDNDYNLKLLPITEYGNFEIIKYKVNFGINDNFYFRPFYIELHENSLFLINFDGKILHTLLENIVNDKNYKIENSFVKSNFEGRHVLGTLIKENELYISHLKKNEECNNFYISKGKISNKEIKFENFFKSEECVDSLQAGRMINFSLNNEKGILLSIGGEPWDNPTLKSQEKNSIIGKTLFIKDNGNYQIFSIGHRTPQGLTYFKNNIISTEHGPDGGDEINKIKFDKNYGWPLASYGRHYSKINKKNKTPYLKDHKSNNFEEPIFTFLKGIGISQIISIPNDFYKLWNNNFIVASLNAGSLYRLKFDEQFNKAIYYEKIFINQRIRDLKFSQKLNGILLALEDKQEIGIFKAKDQ